MPECPRPCDRATGHATPSVHPRSRTQRPQTRGLRRPVRVAPRTLRLCRLELGVVWQRRPESQLPVISLFYGVFPRIFALQNGKKNTRKKTSFPSQNYAPEQKNQPCKRFYASARASECTRVCARERPRANDHTKSFAARGGAKPGAPSTTAGGALAYDFMAVGAPTSSRLALIARRRRTARVACMLTKHGQHTMQM